MDFISKTFRFVREPNLHKMRTIKKLIGLLLMTLLSYNVSFAQKSQTHSKEEIMKKIVAAYYQKMDSLQGDFSKMNELFNDHMVFHFPGVPTPMSVSEFQGPAQGIYAGFSDFKHTIEDLIVEGNKIACRLNITGTHNGEFQGIPASNKSIAINAITIFTIENNKLSEHWVSVDMLGLMAQIGAIPMDK